MVAVDGFVGSDLADAAAGFSPDLSAGLDLSPSPDLSASPDLAEAGLVLRSFLAQPEPLNTMAGADMALRTGSPHTGQAAGPAS